MRDPARIDPLLARLAETWKRYPDLRLGQLVCNVGARALFLEDEPLLAAIEEKHEAIALTNGGGTDA